MKRSFGLLVAVVAVVAAPAAAQDVVTNLIAAANIYGTSEGNVFHTGTNKSQAVDAKHGVCYGQVNWTAQVCTAGMNWRTTNESELTPDLYERYAHWGYGYGRDLYRQCRGVARYDLDTYVTVGTAMGRTNNYNGVNMPFLAQLEYRRDWYGPEGTPDLMETDNQWAWFGTDMNNQIQAGQAPMGHLEAVYQWGPGPPVPGATYVDWTFTGGGITGKLQIAESTIVTKQWSWNADPVNPLLPYYSFDVDPNFKIIDDEWGLREGVDAGRSARGTVYKARAGGSGGAGQSSGILDVEVFYGANENLLYTCQFEGRVYKLTGVKNLGYRRMVGQPGAGERVTGVNGSDAVYTPGTNLYVADYNNGQPLVGDKPNTYPSTADYGSGPNPQGPNGLGISAVEEFYDSAGQRRYQGVAVDAGGRVYVVSQRLMEADAEVNPIFRSSTGDVWGDDPVDPNSLTDANANFASPANDNDVVLLLGGTNVNVGKYIITGVISATKVTLDADPGDSGGAGDASYKMYQAGQNPLPATPRTQGTAGDADRTILLESGNNGTLANGGGAGPYTLADATKTFANVSVDDRMAVLPTTGAGNVGSYTITVVAPGLLTLASGGPFDPDPGAGTPVSYEVFKSSQAVLASDTDADVNGAQLDDANATFLTAGVAANDQLAIISGTGVNVDVYIISAVPSETQILVQVTDNMGNSLAAGDVAYAVLDGEAEFTFSDTAQDFVAAGVKYGDILELPYDGDPNAPNWNVGRRAVRDVNTTSLTIQSDMGDTYGLAGIGAAGNPYYIYEPGSADWISEALVDVFLPDGTLDTTIDLNALPRPDGTTMGAAVVSAQGQSPSAAIEGFMIFGDVEIAPDTAYAQGEEPNDQVTRLWICGLGGDGSDGEEAEDPGNADDGLDLVVVDVTIHPLAHVDQGKVASVAYFGGVDDPDLQGGSWYDGNFNVTGFEPFNMWLMFNDLAFDTLGNMVFAGGRGSNDNRYSAVDATNVALAAGNMIQEQTAVPPEDGVVGISGWLMDLDYIGFGTDFGLAFDDGDVLANQGCDTPLVPPLFLVSTDPAAEGTMPRTANNEIDFVFSAPPPVVAQPLVVTHLVAGCADVSSSFTYTVVGNTLYAKENGQLLTHTNWYRFEPHPTLGSQAFQVDLAVLYGDADRSKQVLAFDYFEVKNNMFYSPAHMSDNCAATPPQTANCGRADLDGSGQVLAFDYFVVKNNMFAVPGAKGVCP